MCSSDPDGLLLLEVPSKRQRVDKTTPLLCYGHIGLQFLVLCRSGLLQHVGLLIAVRVVAWYDDSVRSVLLAVDVLVQPSEALSNHQAVIRLIQLLVI